jgi:hypothetical protein
MMPGIARCASMRTRAGSGVERDERIGRRELLLQRLPGGRVAQLAERADREDPPPDLAGMQVASRRDVETERARDGVQALTGVPAYGVLQRVPFLHEVGPVRAGQPRERGGIAALQCDAGQQRPPEGDDALVAPRLGPVIAPHEQRHQK